MPALQALGDALGGNGVALLVVDTLAQKADFAAGNVAQQARDGAKRGGFSCAVGADQRYDLTFVDLQADSLQGVDLAVVKVQVPDLQYFLRHPVHLPGMLQ